METRKDLCDFFEIDEKTLIYLLFINQKKNYKEFKIPKKAGGARLIKAPVSSIKILQRKLSDSLYLVTKNHKSSHGFVIKRSIKTNAEMHCKKDFVLNLDLEDFFGSIKFGRVVGLFMSRLFNFNKTIAVLLAQICCDDGCLPQGAPTSPIVSNLICYKLDNQLLDFARENYSNYTRYADDITFSFASRKSLSGLINENSPEILSEKLKSIIHCNDFRINYKKVRLSNVFTNRQKVTGLVVNEKINLERRYIKKMRSIIHSCKNGKLEAASKLFFEKNRPSHGSANVEMFKNIIIGRLNFIKQIKGVDSFVWRKLVNDFYPLVYDNYVKKPVGFDEEIQMASWIVESDKDQGTGFCLKDDDDMYFITCAHVLPDDPSIKVFVFNESNIGKKYYLNVIEIDKHRDLVIGELVGISKSSLWYLKMGDSKNLKKTQDVYITGYPNYGPGQKIRIEKAQYNGDASMHGVSMMRTNGKIHKGNSGGAVLDMDKNVIGVSARSEQCFLGDAAFLPIETIYEILKKK